MRPHKNVRPEFVAAFRLIVSRIAAPLAELPSKMLPIKMFVAGGAALHFYTGERVSRDIDAAFSHKLALPERLEVAYRDADGAARILYFDYQYGDTLSLMHEDAHEDSAPLALDGVDAKVLEVRLVSAVDLAVSKIGRFSDQDRDDIALLARRKLISSTALQRRASEAVTAYVGDTVRVKNSIELACRIVKDIDS